MWARQCSSLGAVAGAPSGGACEAVTGFDAVAWTRPPVARLGFVDNGADPRIGMAPRGPALAIPAIVVTWCARRVALAAGVPGVARAAVAWDDRVVQRCLPRALSFTLVSAVLVVLRWRRRVGPPASVAEMWVPLVAVRVDAVDLRPESVGSPWVCVGLAAVPAPRGALVVGVVRSWDSFLGPPALLVAVDLGVRHERIVDESLKETVVAVSPIHRVAIDLVRVHVQVALPA